MENMAIVFVIIQIICVALPLILGLICKSTNWINLTIKILLLSTAVMGGYLILMINLYGRGSV